MFGKGKAIELLDFLLKFFSETNFALQPRFAMQILRGFEYLIRDPALRQHLREQTLLLKQLEECLAISECMEALAFASIVAKFEAREKGPDQLLCILREESVMARFKKAL